MRGETQEVFRERELSESWDGRCRKREEAKIVYRVLGRGPGWPEGHKEHLNGNVQLEWGMEEPKCRSGVQNGEFATVFKAFCYHVKVQNHLIPLPHRTSYSGNESFLLTFLIFLGQSMLVIMSVPFPGGLLCRLQVILLTLPSLNLMWI